jgi:hypothetical protein
MLQALNRLIVFVKQQGFMFRVAHLEPPVILKMASAHFRSVLMSREITGFHAASILSANSCHFRREGVGDGLEFFGAPRNRFTLVTMAHLCSRCIVPLPQQLV